MRARAARLALACAGILLAGCELEPRQWLVSVATDAPVPRFGDHLALEVLEEGSSCTGCLRIIGVDGPESLPATFGVVPAHEGSTVRIRARLYRAEQAGANGLPDSPALIDIVGQLPPLAGETRVALNLPMRCFGVASDLDQHTSCDPSTGAVAAERVLLGVDAAGPQPKAGSWPNAAPAPCRGAVPEGMVCAPGGAFILGAPRPGYVIDLEDSPQPEHLVTLSPFALDIDEVTVGVVRRLINEGSVHGQPIVKDKTNADPLQRACTYLGAADGAADALPVNCISHALASEVCEALGKRLPTEAEWEYAAGNLDAETAYPWGNGGDLCAMALLGRGRTLAESNNVVIGEDSGCRPLDMPSTWGPVAGGNPSDVTRLGIRNLAGSMHEWMADVFAPYTAPCWGPSGSLLTDPRCDTPAPGAALNFAERGSAWNAYKYQAVATGRFNSDKGTGSPSTGFRCAWPPG